jgi:hypothetical protein
LLYNLSKKNNKIKEINLINWKMKLISKELYKKWLKNFKSKKKLLKILRILCSLKKIFKDLIKWDKMVDKLIMNKFLLEKQQMCKLSLHKEYFLIWQQEILTLNRLQCQKENQIKIHSMETFKLKILCGWKIKETNFTQTKTISQLFRHTLKL